MSGFVIDFQEGIVKNEVTKSLEDVEVAIRLSQLISGRLKSTTIIVGLAGDWSSADKYCMVSFAT